jgi:hypothetical protein
MMTVLGMPLLGFFGIAQPKTPLAMVAKVIGIIVGAVVSYAAMLVMSFVGAAVNWVWLWIWNVRGPYAKCYAMTTYAMTPLLVFGWIPFIGMFAVFWEIALLVYATSTMYKTSIAKAVAVWLVLLALIFFLVMLVVGIGVLIVLLGLSLHM